MIKGYLCSAIGRRKESTARVYLKTGSGNIWVNGKDAKDYFYMNLSSPRLIREPLRLFNKENEYDIKAIVKGGGFSSQTGAIVLGIARNLLKVSSEYQIVLKKGGFLTCDSRVKERKKVGHYKARKSHPFVKR